MHKGGNEEEGVKNMEASRTLLTTWSTAVWSHALSWAISHTEAPAESEHAVAMALAGLTGREDDLSERGQSSWAIGDSRLSK